MGKKQPISLQCNKRLIDVEKGEKKVTLGGVATSIRKEIWAEMLRIFWISFFSFSGAHTTLEAKFVPKMGGGDPQKSEPENAPSINDTPPKRASGLVSLACLAMDNAATPDGRGKRTRRGGGLQTLFWEGVSVERFVHLLLSLFDKRHRNIIVSYCLPNKFCERFSCQVAWKIAGINSPEDAFQSGDVGSPDEPFLPNEDRRGSALLRQQSNYPRISYYQDQIFWGEQCSGQVTHYLTLNTVVS